MIGQLGWLDTKLTFWSLLMSFGAVMLATFSIRGTRQFTLRTLQIRLAAAVIAAAIIGAFSTILYLTWNIPGAPIIEGIQGRYFMPLVGCLIVMFAGGLGLAERQEKRAAIIVYIMLSLSTMATLTAIVSRYYAFI